MSAALPTRGLLGKQIRDLRDELGMTQADFANYCGVTQTQVSNWERGRYRPNKQVAWKLHSEHGLPLDAYFTTGGMLHTRWYSPSPSDLGKREARTTSLPALAAAAA